MDLRELIEAAASSDAFEFSDSHCLKAAEDLPGGPLTIKVIQSALKSSNVAIERNDQKRLCYLPFTLLNGDNPVAHFHYCVGGFVLFNNSCFRLEDDPLADYFKKQGAD